jgi:hypothetical protein
LPLLLNFAVEYVIKKVQENQHQPQQNGTHQLMAYADDINMLGENINTITKKAEALLEAIKEVGLEVNKVKS